MFKGFNKLLERVEKKSSYIIMWSEKNDKFILDLKFLKPNKSINVFSLI